MNAKAVSSLRLLSLLAALLSFGCNRSEEPPPPASATEAAESVGQGPDDSAEAVRPLPATTDAQQWLNDAQAAQDAREYDRTVELLLSIRAQQDRLSQAQADAYARQMRSFQSDLAGRVAAGDPEAIAAAEKLRASAPR
jgi:hypothetical protein